MPARPRRTLREACVTPRAATTTRTTATTASIRFSSWLALPVATAAGFLAPFLMLVCVCVCLHPRTHAATGFLRSGRCHPCRSGALRPHLAGVRRPGAAQLLQGISLTSGGLDVRILFPTSRPRIAATSGNSPMSFPAVASLTPGGLDVRSDVSDVAAASCTDIRHFTDAVCRLLLMRCPPRVRPDVAHGPPFGLLKGRPAIGWVCGVHPVERRLCRSRRSP